MTKKHVLGIAATLTGLAALTGCTPSDDKPSETSKTLPAVSIAGYGHVTATLDFAHGIATTPLDRIAFDTPKRDTKYFHALAVRTDECMIKRGFEAIASRTDWSPYRDFEDRTYGQWSVDYASKYGVELAPGTGPQQADTISLGVDFNTAYNTCMDSAKGTMSSVTAFTDSPQVAYRIRMEAYERTLASAAGKKAQASWRECMEAQGVVLDPDDGYPSPQYKAQGKEAEIRVSVIEAKCGVETGAVQALYDTQARYEAAYLDAQAAQVKAFVAKRDKVERELDDAIAGR